MLFRSRGLAGIAFLGTVVGSTQACVEAEGRFYVTQIAENSIDPGEVVDACGGVSNSIIFANAGRVLS